MASTYTASLRTELIGNGDQNATWGDTTNVNLGTVLEQAIAGVATVSITSANQALTALYAAADESRNACLLLTANQAANVYVPPADKVYQVKNTGGTYTVTLYASTVLGNTTAAGTGVSIPAGCSTVVYCDGTNVVSLTTLSTPIGIVPAANGGTGVANGASSTITLGGAVVFSGAYAMQFTVPGAYTYTLPGLTCIVPSEQLQQVSKSPAYTLVLSDANKHIFHPSADTTARTWTIPANSSVAYPVGTVLTFVNQNGAGTITISITTDTMRLAVSGTTGSRTLVANGIASAIKVTSTEWLISGSGLT